MEPQVSWKIWKASFGSLTGIRFPAGPEPAAGGGAGAGAGGVAAAAGRVGGGGGAGGGVVSVAGVSSGVFPRPFDVWNKLKDLQPARMHAPSKFQALFDSQQTCSLQKSVMLAASRATRRAADLNGCVVLDDAPAAIMRAFSVQAMQNLVECLQGGRGHLRLQGLTHVQGGCMVLELTCSSSAPQFVIWNSCASSMPGDSWRTRWATRCVFFSFFFFNFCSYLF